MKILKQKMSPRKHVYIEMVQDKEDYYHVLTRKLIKVEDYYKHANNGRGENPNWLICAKWGNWLIIDSHIYISIETANFIKKVLEL